MAARLQQCWFSDGVCSVFCGLRIVLEHFLFGHMCKKTLVMKAVVPNKMGLACLVIIWDVGREQLIHLYFTVTGRAGSLGEELGGELLCSLEWDRQSDLEVSRGSY